MADGDDPRFNQFVLFQAQNAGLFLGKVPNPATGEYGVNLRAAKSVLDSLELLRDKSTGNLTDSENAFLTKAIENIQGLYGAVSEEFATDEDDISEDADS
ncbi:MAG: DUF1844 domain-containing protein [Verrucomicrobiota bacterium JB023]|nr:DUF1844 domain-containing protein [Verrucomicrobiota bacterium JB023]